MNNKINLIALSFLICLTFVTATTIYAGESYTLQLEEPYEYWSVVGNSTLVDLNITQDGNNVTIIPNKYSQEDSYEIIFLNPEKEIIKVYSGGGGSGGCSSCSGGGIKTIYKNNTIYSNGSEVIKEVPGETVEVIIKHTPWWVWTFVIFLIIIITYLWVFRDRNERGEERYE